jgi:hypothetical protein
MIRFRSWAPPPSLGYCSPSVSWLAAASSRKGATLTMMTRAERPAAPHRAAARRRVRARSVRARAARARGAARLKPVSPQRAEAARALASIVALARPPSRIRAAVATPASQSAARIYRVESRRAVHRATIWKPQRERAVPSALETAASRHATNTRSTAGACSRSTARCHARSIKIAGYITRRTRAPCLAARPCRWTPTAALPRT